MEVISIHRFQEEDLVCRHSSFEEALWAKNIRPTANPLSNVFFDTNTNEPPALVMLDYILEGLKHIHKVGYNLLCYAEDR